MDATTKTIRLSAQLRQIAGSSAITVDVPHGATVRDLFRAIQQAAPELGARIVTEDGDLAPGIQMLIDGRHIDFLQGVDTPVDQANDVFLIPPTYGG